MGYILLGHGGLDVDPSVMAQGMEFVAIPQGTRIQFFADAGQGLVSGPHQLDLWDQLKAPWPPLDSTNVTYNLTLYDDPEGLDLLLANDPWLGGHELIRPGGSLPDPVRLCTGTPRTCPTDPRAVAAGDTHECDGILGRFHGDLYWVACSLFLHADASVTNASTVGVSVTVGLGGDPDWQPDESDQQAIAEVNRANVKHASDGEALDYVIGGFLFLIGAGHQVKHQRYARFQRDSVQGALRVHKNGVFHNGALAVDGIGPSQQGLVEYAVGRFSDKEVRFT